MEERQDDAVKQRHLEIYDVKRICADLLNCQHQFSDFQSKTNFTIASKGLELFDSDESSLLGDGSIHTNSDYQIVRMAKIASFDNIKASIEQYENSLHETVSKANEIIEFFLGESMWLDHVKSLTLITPDENTLLSNKKWMDNMHYAYDDLNFYLEEIEVVINYLEKRLAMYEVGDSRELIPEKAVFRPRPQ